MEVLFYFFVSVSFFPSLAKHHFLGSIWLFLKYHCY